MPVDLSEIGESYPYPTHGPRLLPWLGIWFACSALGVPMLLLAWPTNEPASGLSFWCAIIGVPNFVFLVLLCIGRIGYEALWTYAHNHNQARKKRLTERLRIAQKPLQVLGVGYCVPSVASTLLDTVAANRPLVRSQRPRGGVGYVVHNRFEEGAWAEKPMLAVVWDDNPDDRISTQTAEPQRIASVVLKLVRAIEPLVPALQALSEYGPQYAPLVRVLTLSDETDKAIQHARDALRLTGLPALECAALPASRALVVADDWLDTRERRTVLILAYAWHDANPPERSSEAAVAVLLNTDFYRLPDAVRVFATLHRPIEDQANPVTLRELALNAARGARRKRVISRAPGSRVWTPSTTARCWTNSSAKALRISPHMKHTGVSTVLSVTQAQPLPGFPLPLLSNRAQQERN